MSIARARFFLGIALFAGALSGAARSEDAPRIVSVEKIWDQGDHNAFTDLIRFQDQWHCTFREAEGHVGGDGKLRVLRSADGVKWESTALLAEDGIDLRDPKLSITPDGRLMMTAGGSVYRVGKQLLGRQPRVAFSSDGQTWTPTQRILSEGEWLWRATWHEGRAYGVSYNATGPIDPATGKPSDWHLTLVSSPDGVQWETVARLEVPDRANETTLRFTLEGEMIALVRREGTAGKNVDGWIGTSRPPYQDWNWHSAGLRIGGPNFIILPSGAMWATGRKYEPAARTWLSRMTRAGLTPALEFPSGGDNSYAGMVWHEGLLWMSYYSSHEGKTSIYLAKVALPEE